MIGGQLNPFLILFIRYLLNTQKEFIFTCNHECRILKPEPANTKQQQRT